MSDFRIIEATINPKRTDNLHDRVLPHIGKRMRLMHAWHIDEEEGPAEYVGQDAYNPLVAIGWLPTEDLDDIKTFDGGVQEAFLDAAPGHPTHTVGSEPARADDKLAQMVDAVREKVGPVKMQTLSDSLISYGVDVLDGVRNPYRNHHVVSYKYADDGSVVSRTETTTRTYADDDEDES